MLGRLSVLLVSAVLSLSAQAQEKLTIASGAQGNWETAAAELGRSSGIFKKHGLDVQLLWTQGGGETQQAVTAGSADIGIGLGLAAVMSAYTKGAPIRPVANAMTGPDVYWYVPANSPIKSLKDAAGKTVSYSTLGSSTYIAVLGLQKLYGVDFKPVATGSPAATYTQVMSGQVDIGWAGPPFGMDQLKKGLIRVVVREAELPEFQDQTVRVMISNLNFITARPKVLETFRKAYMEVLDWMYSDPAAVKAYSAFSGIPEDIAVQVRDEFFPRNAVNLNRLGGVDFAMKDAVEMKFLKEPLTRQQQDEFFAHYAK
jgi:NitT/TauT family transport system substrate-binding protein